MSTGNFDAVLEMSEAGINRMLSLHHRDERFQHAEAVEYNFGIPDLAGLSTDSHKPPAGIRVRTEVQIDTPRVTIPARAGNSLLDIHYPVRVHQGENFFHGELIVKVEIEQWLDETGPWLLIDFTRGDVSMEFAPAAGTSPTADDIEQIESAALYRLSNGYETESLRLLPDTDGEFAVQHWRLKTLPHVVAMMLNFEDRTPSAADVAAVHDVFLDESDDLALAISPKYISNVVCESIKDRRDRLVRLVRLPHRPDKDERQLGEDEKCIPIDLDFFCKDVRYVFELSDDPVAIVDLLPGRLRVRLEASGRGPNDRWPGMYCIATQDFTIDLDGGRVEVNLHSDEMQVEIGLSGSPSGTRPRQRLVREKLDEYRLDVEKTVYGRVGPRFQTAANDATKKLNEMLSNIGGLTDEALLPSLNLVYRHVSINSDGLTIQGQLLTSYPPVVADFDLQVVDCLDASGEEGWCLELNAFPSWVPGGVINSYSWYLYETAYFNSTLWEKSHTDRFVARLDPSLISSGSWPPHMCHFFVYGKRDGNPISGDAVQVIGIDLPPLPPRKKQELPISGLPILVTTAGQISAYLDPWYMKARETPRRIYQPPPRLHLIEFLRPGERLDEIEAIAATKDLPGQLIVTVVFQPGEFSEALPQKFPSVAFAVDHEGGWYETWGVKEPGMALVVDAQGKEKWRDQRLPSVADLNRIIAEQAETTGRRHRNRRTDRLKPGQRAPQVFLPMLNGHRVALQQFKGSPVTLCFWKTWAEPSWHELRRLQNLRKNGSRRHVILAINDGEAPGKAAEWMQGNDISLKLIADPDRAIARSFGIYAWPTTVDLDTRGRVQAVQLGRRLDEIISKGRDTRQYHD